MRHYLDNVASLDTDGVRGKYNLTHIHTRNRQLISELMPITKYPYPANIRFLLHE